MTRRSFPSALISAVVLMFGISCGSQEILGKNKSAQSPVTVVSMSGQAAKSGAPLKSNEKIQPGETIVTGEGASLKIKIPGRAAMSLTNAGKIVFDELGDTVVLTLEYGSMMSVVAKADKKFVLRTPAASVGVRGTAFYVESRALDQTYICLCEGSLEISDADSGTIQRIDNPDRKQHKPVLIAPSAAGVMRATSAPMINHTNADIASLESILQK